MSSNEATAAATEQSSAAARPYWIGVGLVAIGVVWVHGGLSLPQGARYAAVGPGLVPTLVGAGLALIGIVLCIQIARGERFEAQDAEDAAAGAPMERRAFLTALLAVALPVATMRGLGLPLTAAASFALVCRALGSTRPIVDVATGAVLGVVSWFLFGRLGLQLGPFLPLLGI